MGESDASEVVVIGSGFGGSVATLRFAEAGHRVVVLERGDHVSRDKFQVDLDFLWKPEWNAYGFHDIRRLGSHLIPWTGAAVGGGSHVYAGTLKRRESFDDFPEPIRSTDMTPYYERAERMLGAAPYPDWKPYSDVRATKLMYRVGKRLKDTHPKLVEDFGPVNLGISFAPEDKEPGAAFENEHGCMQRYHDPDEQAILGGDIDAKNTLDRNYLFVATRAEVKAEIRPLCEADRIEVLPDGKYRVHYVTHQPLRGWAGFRRRWLFGPAKPPIARSIDAKHVVIAAGALGSTQLLLRNRELHKTLAIGNALGTKYTTNGDYLTLIVPFRGLFLSWLGFAAAIVCLFLGQWYGLAAALAAYYGGLAISQAPSRVDAGTTNSDNIRFKNHRGESQGAYVESGRYPTPGRLLAAVVMSSIGGRFRPRAYRVLRVASRVIAWIVPPFGALARTYPIPLLMMGKDDAFGTFRLDARGRAQVDFDVDANKQFYAHLEQLGRKVAHAADAYFVPDVLHKVLGRLEIPHNQGGVPIGESPADGVVDHAGRVFGMPNLMVLDGAIIPQSVGPNPALTIAAVAERAMEIAIAQLERDGVIATDIDAAPAEVAAAS